MVLFNDNFVTLHGGQICLCTKLVAFLKALHHENVNTINLKKIIIIIPCLGLTLDWTSCSHVGVCCKSTHNTAKMLQKS